MAFEFQQASECTSLERAHMIGSAFRKTGRPVVLVPLGEDTDELHAGHISLIRAARTVPRAVVVVAWNGGENDEKFAEEKVDVVWRVGNKDLWPDGEPRVTVTAQDHGLEDVDAVTAELTRLVALIGALGPSDIVVGEKDFELMAELASAVQDLHLPVQIHGVPTVRMPGGLAISLRNVDVAEDARDQALALSAALTAGAHLAEQGEEAVVDTARAVLDAAGITPEYLELRSTLLGPAPKEGDARLFVAAEIGGVRLTDNAGVPIGIGFKNLGND